MVTSVTWTRLTPQKCERLGTDFRYQADRSIIAVDSSFQVCLHWYSCVYIDSAINNAPYILLYCPETKHVNSSSSHVSSVAELVDHRNLSIYLMRVRFTCTSASISKWSRGACCRFPFLHGRADCAGLLVRILSALTRSAAQRPRWS